MVNEAESDDGARNARRRREQRQIARLHHPDRGGDPQQYLRLMRELDARFGSAQPPAATPRPRPAPGGPVGVTVTTGSGARTTVRRGLRASGRVVAVVRSRLPRGMPGARRFIDL